MTRYRFVAADSTALRRLPFERMEAEGMTRAVLWNRVRPCLVDWLECVNPNTSRCWLAYAPVDGLVGAMWLNPVLGCCGTVHFAIFRNGRRDWKRLGREAIRHLFAELPLKSLLAFWPAHFRHVGHAAKHWGFGKPLPVPGACPMPTVARPGRCRDGHMAVLTREAFLSRFGGA